MTANSPTIRFYCTLWCSDCTRAQQLLDERGIAYDCIDIDTDAGGAAYVRSVNNGYHSVPTLVFPDGSILVEPSDGQLSDRLQQLGLGRPVR